MSKFQTSAKTQPLLFLAVLFALALGFMAWIALPVAAQHADKPLTFNQADQLPLIALDFNTVLEECQGVDTNVEDGWVFIHPPVPKGGFTVLDLSFSSGLQTLADVVQSNSQGSMVTFTTPKGASLDAVTEARGFVEGHDHFVLTHTCAKPGTVLDIEKTAVADPITIGDKFAYDITVSDDANGIAPINLSVSDELQPPDRDWEIISQDADAGCSIVDGIDGDGHLDFLTCSPSFGDGGSASVRVQTTAAATAADCDTSHTNVAFADADNADEVWDDASIDVLCGGVKVVKTAKHADTTGATSANLAATFRITDSNGDTHDVTTDAATGIACVDDLPIGAATVVELSGPSGYQADPDTENVTVTDADCPDPGAGATASFENIPLTDITWTVDSQHDGATSTTVTCYDSTGAVISGYPVTVSDGTDTLPSLLPTAPEVTITCEFVIDP